MKETESRIVLQGSQIMSLVLLKAEFLKRSKSDHLSVKVKWMSTLAVMTWDLVILCKTDFPLCTCIHSI